MQEDAEHETERQETIVEEQVRRESHMKRNTHLQISQNSSSRSADKSKIKLKTLGWLEAVV
jgi:hypothetical protein